MKTYLFKLFLLVVFMTVSAKADMPPVERFYKWLLTESTPDNLLAICHISEDLVMRVSPTHSRGDLEAIARWLRSNAELFYPTDYSLGKELRNLFISEPFRLNSGQKIIEEEYVLVMFPDRMGRSTGFREVIFPIKDNMIDLEGVMIGGFDGKQIESATNE